MPDDQPVQADQPAQSPPPSPESDSADPIPPPIEPNSAPIIEPISTNSAQPNTDVIPNAVEGSPANTGNIGQNPTPPSPPQTEPVSTVTVNSPVQPVDIKPPLTSSNSPLDYSNTSSFDDLIKDLKPEELAAPPPPISTSPSDQVSQVQSVPSDNTPGDILEKPQNSKPVEPVSEPKPPESPTMPSISPQSSSTPAPTTSFGDILAGNTNPVVLPPVPSPPDLSSLNPPSDLPDSYTDNSPARNASQSDAGGQPTTYNPQPVTSFGDLIKDIKPEESVIPSIPSTSSNPPLNSSDNLLSLRRQKANQTRMAKRQKRLDKLTELVKTKGKFTSVEAQQILDIPQSTLGDYFQDLVDQGVIKKFGKGRGMYYTM